MNCKNDDYDYATELSGNRLLIECGSKILANRVEKLIDEFDYVDCNRYWKSKFNSFVSYDYEPLCVEAFNSEFNLEFRTNEKAQYFLYLINREFTSLIKLEKDFKLDIDKRTKEYNKVKELQET